MLTQARKKKILDEKKNAGKNEWKKKKKIKEKYSFPSLIVVFLSIFPKISLWAYQIWTVITTAAMFVVYIVKKNEIHCSPLGKVRFGLHRKQIIIIIIPEIMSTDFVTNRISHALSQKKRKNNTRRYH